MKLLPCAPAPLRPGRATGCQHQKMCGDADSGIPRAHRRFVHEHTEETESISAHVDGTPTDQSDELGAVMSLF